MKKAQLEQPFIIILGVVVMALVLIFGADVIVKSLKLGSDVELNVFVDKLKKEIESCYNLDFGSTCSLDKLSVPSSLNYICIVNTGEDIDINKLPRTFNDTIINSINLGRKENVFLIPLNLKNEKLGIRIDNLRANENPLCSNIVRGKINLVLENKGTFIEIRK